MEIQADNLVLTKNAEGTTTDNVEAQEPNLSAVPKKDHFPVFILGMTFIQVRNSILSENEIILNFVLNDSCIRQVFFFYTANQSLMLAFWLDPYRRYEVWRFITASLVHQQ